MKFYFIHDLFLSARILQFRQLFDYEVGILLFLDQAIWSLCAELLDILNTQKDLVLV